MLSLENEIQVAKSTMETEQSLLAERVSVLGISALIQSYGSLSTNHFRGWRPNRVGDTRPLDTFELDILCRVSSEDMVRLSSDCESSLGYEKLQSGNLLRWAQEFKSEVLSKLIQGRDGRSILIELLLIEPSYLPIDVFWKEVFSPSEIKWQSEIRNCLSDFGDDILYFETKCLQVRECRWRTIAAYAARHLSELCDHPGIPQFAKGAVPPILEPLVEGWLTGKVDVKDLIRPFTDFVPGAKKIITDNSPSLLAPPMANSFYQSAASVQWKIIQDIARLRGRADSLRRSTTELDFLS